jgi:hypothetical protein
METGLVVAPTIDQLSFGLQTYIDKPDLITKLGQSARIRANLDYTNEVSASRHEEYFATLLKLLRK